MCNALDFFSTHIKLECHKFSETKGKEFDIFFLFVKKQKYAKVRRADNSHSALCVRMDR